MKLHDELIYQLAQRIRDNPGFCYQQLAWFMMYDVCTIEFVRKIVSALRDHGADSSRAIRMVFIFAMRAVREVDQIRTLMDEYVIIQDIHWIYAENPYTPPAIIHELYQDGLRCFHQVHVQRLQQENVLAGMDSARYKNLVASRNIIPYLDLPVTERVEQHERYTQRNRSLVVLNDDQLKNRHFVNNMNSLVKKLFKNTSMNKLPVDCSRRVHARLMSMPSLANYRQDIVRHFRIKIRQPFSRDIYDEHVRYVTQLHRNHDVVLSPQYELVTDRELAENIVFWKRGEDLAPAVFALVIMHCDDFLSLRK